MSGVSGKIRAQTTIGGTDYILREITISLGGTTGWHYHDGTLYAFVKQGTLTHTEHTCATDGVYQAGASFTEPSGPTSVHVGGNLKPSSSRSSTSTRPAARSPKTPPTPAARSNKGANLVAQACNPPRSGYREGASERFRWGGGTGKELVAMAEVDGGRITVIQKVAAAVGVVFLLVGVLGFVPGITTDYDTMSFGGHHSEAMLLGVFQVSVLHNVAHLLFGVAGLLLARTVSGARAFLIGGGVVYAVLWLYGLLIDQASSANFVPVNTADNWLHLILAVGMIAVGLLLGRAATKGTEVTHT
ncbi:uncharacterized protein DUF4383 [Kribbella antiqua]|uniref:Uncharacterized protein DUF4383 n=1 Tax=Kribbella antiqua TaxID=2512217 RepID=A0A4R2J121_9ACTN|nr:DUF4383 domain-containing protein [Kribbella antiqua]TCO50486.1 uncharacterized protein DUF4383 [Kribbella antiqua]